MRYFLVLTLTVICCGCGTAKHSEPKQLTAKDPGTAASQAPVGESPKAVPGPTATRPLADIVTSKGTIRVALYADEAPKTVENFLRLAEGTKEFTDPRTNATSTKPFYDGLTFHRVIKGFMIQGGDPLGNGNGTPGFSFADEINASSLGLDSEKVLLTEDQINPFCIHQLQQFKQEFLLPVLKAHNIGPQTPPAELEAAKAVILSEMGKVTVRQLFEKIGYMYNDALPASHHPRKGSLAMANSGPATNGCQFFINLVDTPQLTGKHTVFGEVVAGMEVVEAIGEVAVDPGTNKPIEAVTIISIRSVKPAIPGK